MKKRTGIKQISIRLFNRTLHMTKRMLALIIAIMIIPVSAGLTLYTIHSALTMEEEILRTMQVTVSIGKDNLDYRMGQWEESSMAILTSVYPYLNSAADVEEQMNEYREMTRLLNEYKGKNMITKLRLYVPDSKLYSSQNYTFYSLEELIRTTEFEDDNFKPNSGTYWLETYDIVLTFGEKSVQVMSCATAVSSAKNFERLIGALFVDISVPLLNEMLSSSISADEEMFLVNQEGIVLSHSDSSKVGLDAFSTNNLPDFANESSGYLKSTIDNEEHLLVYTRLDTTNWYLVLTEPRSRVFSSGIFSLDMFRLFTILFILVSFVIGLIMIYNIVIKSTLHRINSAINSMNTDGFKTIQQLSGEVDIIHSEGQTDTLATLEKNTNRMVMAIKALLDREYKNEIAVRDYHMKALQAQINPHFLYNTLDVIKWMIFENEQKDSVWMVNALSRYFQLSISKGRDTVRIQEEIELTKTYLGIMQRRFKDVFTTKFDIAAEVNDFLIPKLSLQPIVENALLHGVLYSEKKELVLSISARLEAEKVIIRIEDNGDGMDEVRLRAIQDGTESGKSYGLSNVKSRLVLYGAGTDGFEISSETGQGTTVVLRIPIKRQDGQS